MALESGTRLGHYEVTHQIGKGGMGEVYRARDAKLGREVAIKVLPSEFSQDAERLARLEREARMLAALNHPNIAAIYGLEQSDDTRFLVLELVEGDTLADRLKRGAIPVEEALKLALQIAEALEAAHDKGVVHRDLKPANIKVTPEGRVKVLDFGLAKAFIGDQADVNLSNSPTLSMAATQAGIILGTAAYMSPEQAEGQTADSRADIWSFGVVLFEMLTGRQTFDGKTVARVLAAVLNSEPEWNGLPANLHPRVRILLERSLEKEPKDRLSGISDARVEIQKVLADPNGVLVQPLAEVQSVPKSGLSAWLPWVAAFVIGAVVTGAGVWMVRPTSGELHPIVRYPFIVPEDQQLTGLAGRAIDTSRDGTQFAYTADNIIYIKSLESMEPRLVQGVEPGALTPTFSPDGLSLAYHSGAPGGFAIQRIPVTGGTSVTVWEGPARPVDMRWERDNTILFVQPEGIFQISSSGGDARLIVTAGEGEELGSPSLLPGSGDVLFTVTGSPGSAAGWDSGAIFVEPVDSSIRSLVREGGSDPRFVPTGHIVYAQGNTLFGLPFDLASLQVLGGASAIVDRVQRSGNGATSTAQYAFSDTGTLVQLYPDPADSASAIADTSLLYAERNGDTERIDIRTGSYGHPRVSPDGTQLTFEIAEADGRSEVWVYDLDGDSEPRQLTQGGTSSRPIWSPDGEYVTFMSTRGGTPSIWWQKADLSEAAEQLTQSEGAQHWPDAWSPDGTALAFTRFASNLDQSIRIWTPADGDEPAVFVPDLAGGAAFSPGGDWIAYRASRNTETPADVQLFLQPFPGGGTERPVSLNGGSFPIFSPDGSELIYRRPSPAAGGPGQNELVRIPVSTEGTVTYGTESVIPISGLPARFGIRDYDVMPDGRLILMRIDGGVGDVVTGPREFRVVLNWFEELRERVPVN